MSDCSTSGLSPGLRLLVWVGSLLSLGTAGAVAWWGLTGLRESASGDRLEATILPSRFLERADDHLAGLELFASFDYRIALSLLVVLVWVWALVGCGAFVVERTMRKAAPLEMLVFSFASGYVLIALGTLLLGLVGLARPVPLVLFVLGCAGVAFMQGRIIFGWLRGLGPVWRRPALCHFARNGLLAALLFGLVATLVTALTPPIQSDALRYHLAAPQEFLKAGRIGYLPWNAFSNFPFLADMHFMLALAAQSPAASQLMHFVTAVMTALAVAAMVQRFVMPLFSSASATSVSPAVLCAIAYLSIPAGLALAGWPFVDHAVALFFLLSLYALLMALEKSSAGTWTLLGLIAGGAIGTKYTALPHVAVLGGLALLEWIAFSPPRSTNSARTLHFRHLLLAAALAAAVGGVWFAKSLVLTGNPVYPLAGSVFPGGDWTQESAELYKRKTEEKGAPKTLQNLITSPTAATFSWTAYERHFLGPWLLVAMLAGLIGLAAAVSRCRWRARPLIWVAVTAGAYYVTWFFSYQSNRMLLPFLAMLLPLAAILPAAAGEVSRFSRVMAAAAFSVCVLYGIAWAVQWQYVRAPYPSQIRYVLGDMSRDEYLVRALPHYRAFQELKRRIRPGEKVLFVGEHRVFYASFEAVWSDWFDTPAVLGIMRESNATSAEELLAELRRRKVRWIFHNARELSLGGQLEVYFRPRFRESEWQILENLFAHPGLERISVSPDMTLLRLPDGTATAQ